MSEEFPRETGLPTEVVSPETMRRSLKNRVRDLMRQGGDEYAMKVLEEMPNIFDALLALAQGITIRDVVNEKTYRVPPDWQAVKYLADWGRQIMGMDTARRVEHDLPDDTKALMRDYLEAKQREEPAVVEAPDGVVVLQDE